MADITTPFAASPRPQSHATPSLSNGTTHSQSGEEGDELDSDRLTEMEVDAGVQVQDDTQGGDGDMMDVDQQEQEGEAEEEQDEEEEKPPIPQPAYFYQHEHTSYVPPKWDPVTKTFSLWLTPEDDPYATRGIPVFKPTWEEFEEFETYMEGVAPWGHKSGIIKVIPPAEWTMSLPSIPTQTMSDLRVKNPIQQNMLGRAGLFRQNTIEKKKALTVKEWWEKGRSGAFQYPGPKDAELRGKRGSAAPPVGARASKRRKTSEAPVNGNDNEEADTSTQEVQVPLSATQSSSSTPMSAKFPTSTNPTPPISDRAPSATPAPSDKPTIDPWYETFNPHSDWLPKGASEEDYSAEGCRALERKFWRELGLGEACWYGADMKGSLFTEETTSWNVAHLPNLLNRLNLKRKLPGVNTPYLYWGMWAAAFAWHVEDMDLYSINYIHFGAPKFWYAIPQKKAETFERHMASYFPSDSRKCDQFLRHKSFAVSPNNLGQQGTRPNILVHKQGEFVITFPKGYHAGFNLGFNCAESINFALDDWVDVGRRAKVCTCESDNVRIDIDAVLQESALREAAEVAREERRLQLEERKRQKLLAAKQARPRKPKAISSIFGPKKPSIKLVIPKVSKPVYCCALCPDTAPLQLIPIHRDATEIPDGPGEEKRKRLDHSHLACVRSTPELWIADVWDEAKSRSVRKVMGMDGISKDRWNLKCSSCTDVNAQKYGSKIQCTKGKCVRAYHVTCAVRDPHVEFKELEVDEWVALEDAQAVGAAQEGDIEVDVGADAKQKAKRFERVTVVHAQCLCPQHNPAIQEIKKKSLKSTIAQEYTALPYGCPISIKLATGIWGSYLLSIDSDEESAVVTTDKGVPFTLKWGQIVFVPVGTAAEEGERKVVDTAPSLQPPPKTASVTPTPPPSGQLQPTGQIALTPQMIKLLSGNPLLRASLREVGVSA